MNGTAIPWRTFYRISSAKRMKTRIPPGLYNTAILHVKIKLPKNRMNKTPNTAIP